jgi:integrase/recombinase XerD
MTTIATARPTIQLPEPEYLVDDAQLAGAAFLARYSGRTLDAYRHDLRGFFQWAADNAIPVLDATRPHIELYRAWMEQRGLAASTIDRRLSTVCGFYRFAHIDGRIGSNPAQYVRRPPVHPSDARGLDRSELGVFLFTAEQYDHDHAALAVLLGLNGLRVSEACATNVEDLGLERGHRTLRILGKGNRSATVPLVPRTAHHRPCRRRTLRGADPAPPRRGTPRPPHRASVGTSHWQAGWPRRCPPAHAPGGVHHGGPRRRSAPGDVQTAARHADPRTTTIYDRRRQNFDRHAAYVVVAFVAGG